MGREIDWENRLAKAEELLSLGAEETDDYGQILIYTGLIEDEDTGKIRPMTEDDLED